MAADRSDPTGSRRRAAAAGPQGRPVARPSPAAALLRSFAPLHARALGRQARARLYRASNVRIRPRPPRRSRFTGRAALLVLVLCSLVVVLAYPTRQYIAQRAEITKQRAAAEQARKRVQELREEKARWQDPAYIEAQARERLHFVKPGETGYSMAEPGGYQGTGKAPGTAGRSPASGTARSAAGAAASRPWYENLWQTLNEHDKP